MKLYRTSIVLAAILATSVSCSSLEYGSNSTRAFREIASKDPVAPFFMQGYPIQIAPGSYNFNALDQTKVADYVLKQFEKVRGEDRAIIENAIKSLNEKYVAMTTLVYGNGGLSQKSVNSSANPASSSGKLTVRDVMQLQLDFDRNLSLFANDVATIDALPQMLSAVRYEPNLATAAVDQLAGNLKNVNFEQFKTYYSGQVSNLKSAIDRMDFGILLPSGAPFMQHGLSDLTELKKQKLFSARDIQELQLKVGRLRAAMNTVNTGIAQTMHPAMLKMLRNVITQFGERNRYRTDENDSGRKQAIKNIEELFYVRSGLRAKYGIPLGAIKVNYTMYAGNADKMLSTLVLDAGIARSIDELTTDQNNLFNALEGLNYRSARALFKPGRTFFSRVSGIVSMLKGQSNTVAIKTVLLPFLLQDVAEEVMLSTSAGWNGVLDGYKKRYNTKDGGDWAAARMMYFPKTTEKTGSAQQTRMDVDSIIGLKNVADLLFSSKLADISDARDIEKQLEALQMADAIFKEVGARNDDL